MLHLRLKVPYCDLDEMQGKRETAGQSWFGFLITLGEQSE
jgi:hypothetical protein